MKKLLMFLILFFIGINVYALKSPNIELRVINQNGVEIKDENETLLIPAQATVKLLDNLDGKPEVLVQYNEKSVYIKRTDLKPVQETFDSSLGYKLESDETVKIFDSLGLNMYKGPNTTFYDKLDKTIPSGTEIMYSYIDNEENTTDKYAYVTYEGVSGWVLIDFTNEKCAKKEASKIKILNSANIEIKDGIKGNKIESTIKNGEVLDYNYVTKYQYNVIYGNKSVWLSIIGEDAIAPASTIESISLNVGDKIYENPSSDKTIHEITELITAKPLFYYNGFYYVEMNDIKGWIKPESIIGNETSSKVELTEKEVITPGPITDEKETSKAENKKTPTKVELIIIIGLAILLLLSLTSLVALVIMNKKNGVKLPKEEDEADNSIKEGE